MASEKRKDKVNGEALPAALNPVANFHLSNGASIGSINYLANLSDRGQEKSFEMMVNYIYTAKKLDSNKIDYSQGIIDSKV